MRDSQQLNCDKWRLPADFVVADHVRRTYMFSRENCEMCTFESHIVCLSSRGPKS